METNTCFQGIFVIVSFTHREAASSFPCGTAAAVRCATAAASVGCNLTIPSGVTGKSGLSHNRA
jgi:hypothetical protein